MSVYVDNAKNRRARLVLCHMMADTDNELHVMAEALGMKREWLHGDHYDISQTKRGQAVKLGAVEITVEQSVWLRRKKRTPINGYTLGNPRVYEPMFVDPGFCKGIGGGYFPTAEAAAAAIDPDGTLPTAWFGDKRLPARVYALHGAEHDGTCDEVGAARLVRPAFLSRVTEGKGS